MKKITLLLLSTLASVGFAQQKSTGVITLSNNIPITANFTLDNATSQVTLILTGPSDRWFGLAIGVNEGFGMANADVLVINPSLTDRNFIGFQEPATDASQSWTTVSNVVNGAVRTLNLTRALTNTDTAGKDFQLPYATTSSISIAGVRAPSATFTVAPHGGKTNVGYATAAAFATLGVEDFSLNASQVYPNPSNGEFTVKTKTNLEKINIYTQTGVFVKTVNNKDVSDTVEVNVNGLQTGIYLIELVNSSSKSWKKVIVN